MRAKVDHTLKLVHITSKGVTTSYSYDGYKFNPAEFSNFSYDFGYGNIIQII